MCPADKIMSVFPCRLSLKTNIRYRLYCEPAKRSTKAGSRFIGFYADKTVSHLACVRTVVTGWVRSAGFVVHRTEKGTLSCDEASRIDDAIRSFVGCFDESFSRIEQRFYLLDDIHETDFAKASKYGLWRGRDFDLGPWLKEGQCSLSVPEEAARALWGKKWE